MVDFALIVWDRFTIPVDKVGGRFEDHFGGVFFGRNIRIPSVEFFAGNGIAGSTDGGQAFFHFALVVEDKENEGGDQDEQQDGRDEKSGRAE